MTSFIHRKIDLIFSLVSGTFDDQGEADTVKLTGLRVLCEVDSPGGPELSQANLRVYGMKQDDMDRLTVLARQSMSLAKNSLQIDIGDDVDGMSTLFVGSIFNAFADYQAAPDVPFIVHAVSGLYEKVATSNAESYKGAVPVLTMFESIAKQLNATLENNGVTGTLSDQMLVGSPIEKLRKLADAAQVDYYYLPPVLAICPQGAGRSGADAVLVNASSGMVGWPTIDRMGVAFTTLYNPAIQHGGRIKLESSLKNANGQFYVYTISHRLESEKPGGAWFSHVLATEQRSAVRL